MAQANIVSSDKGISSNTNNAKEEGKSGRRAWGKVVTPEVVRQRRQLGQAGVVQVMLAVHGEEAHIRLQMVGVSEDEAVQAQALQAARKAWTESQGQGLNHDEQCEQIRRAVRRKLREQLGNKPLVRVTQVRVGS